MDRKPASYHTTRQVIDQFQINSDFTDGVYVSELLFPFSDEVEFPSPFLSRLLKHVCKSCVLSNQAKEESRDSDNGIFDSPPDYEIVMYISATAKFPNHRNYTWKVSTDITARCSLHLPTFVHYL
jgi:hypothetical protein